MKMHELLEDKGIRIRLSSAWQTGMTYDETPSWSDTHKEAVKCTICNGKGKIRKLVKLEDCKNCKGEGYVPKYNTAFVEFTESEHEFIKSAFVNKVLPSYMNNASPVTTNIIPRNLIQRIFNETVKFINNDQTHLDKPESSNTTRSFKEIPGTNIVNLKVNKKIIEPVDSDNLIELTKEFSKFLHNIRGLPDASIRAETRFYLPDHSL